MKINDRTLPHRNRINLSSHKSYLLLDGFMEIKSIRRENIMKFGLKLCVLSIMLFLSGLMVVQVAEAALFVTRAELKNGSQLRLEGNGAVPNATITVDGVALGNAGSNGAFRFEQSGFSAPTCNVTVSDGTTTVQVSLSGCTPTSVPPPGGGTAGEPQKLFDAGAQIGERFGDSVAVDGDWAIIGATEIRTGSSTQTGIHPDAPPPGPGKAFFYHRNGSTWSQAQTVSGSANFNQFGISANLSGNVAIIGERLGDGAFENSGAAYIYRLNGASWSQEAKLTRSDAGVTNAATHPFFGESVAIDGDRAIIGSPHKDLASDIDRAGEAYIYRRNASGAWLEEIKLSTLASGHDPGDNFGSAVAIQGNIAVVGAEFDENAGGEQRGAAYVFEFDGTTWREVARLLPSNPAASFFGEALAISGDAIAVGAVGDTVPENPNCNFNCGAVYIFRRQAAGSAWIEEQKIFRNDPLATNFGISVDIDGNLLVAGARFQTTTTARTGAAYLFRFDGAAWSEVAGYAPADARQDDEIGREVAVSGSAAFIGAPFEDPFFPGSTSFPFEENQGAVYVFPTTAAPPSLTVNLAGTGNGSVTSNPAGINCGSDCQEIFPFDTQVSLSATPLPGSTFAGFGGHPDCGDGIVTVSASLTCTATFDLESNPQPPVANAGPDQTVTDSDGNGLEEVILDGSASTDPDGAIASYEWREGGALLASGANAIVSLAVGSHTIELAITDNSGATATDTLIVTVEAPPPASASLSMAAPASVNRGDNVSITLTVNNTGPATLTNVELALDWTPDQRLKNLSAPKRVTIADVPPGGSGSFTWTARTDKEGDATLTGQVFSNSSSLDLVNQILTILK